MKKILFVAGLLGAAACSGSEPGDDSGSTAAVFDLSADLTRPEDFYRMPWPDDARLLPTGKPDLRGLPGKYDLPTVEAMRDTGMDRPGFSVLTAAYFLFGGDLAPRDLKQVIPADKSSPILLIDVDPASPERGRFIPTVASILARDPYVPEPLLAVAARPGFVLAANRKYAFVVQRALGDAAGKRLAANAKLAEVGPTRYAALWETLSTAGIDPGEIAAATQFTTGDVVAELADLSTRVVAKHRPEIQIRGLHPDPDDGVSHERFCELLGTVRFPQFQKGRPPFNTDGLFVPGPDGLPVKQREEEAKVVITLPKAEMPAGGFPLIFYSHGSGNLSSEVVDRGKVETPDGPPRKGEGPAHVLAAHGIGTVGMSFPLNPERLPGADDTEYLNTSNIIAIRDTFRQGVIEARLMIDALERLRIATATVAGCNGLTLPAGETEYRFETSEMFAMGNSMGGMYSNLIGAVEPKVAAVVPSGAGGFWTYFILDNPYRRNAGELLGALIFGTDEVLTFVHPAMVFGQTAIEASDPIVYMPRLGRRPLPDHPVRSVFQPVGKDDKYFPATLFDAVALAFGNKQAGTTHWESMQAALQLAGLGGIAGYPVKDNLSSEAGQTLYTGVVVQYSGNGESDPHSIFSQLDSVKYQYGCFLKTKLDTGTAVVPAPMPLGTPCPR